MTNKLTLGLLLLAPLAQADEALFADPPEAGRSALNYLNKETTAAVPLRLSHGDQEVTTLPAGAPLTVLLSDREGHFLVKTPLGLLGWASATKEAAPDPFTGLKEFKDDQESPSFTLHYRPETSQVINKTLTEEDWEYYHFLDTALTPGGPIQQWVCEPGPSGDPACGFFPAEAKKYMTQSADNWLGGDHFYLPGDGYVYSTSDSNEFYVVRQKFKVDLEKQRFDEVRQPYYYVGVDSVVQRPLEAESVDGGKMTLSKGDKVQVLLDAPERNPCFGKSEAEQEKDKACNDTRLDLLLRTESGALAWLEYKPFANPDDPNEGPGLSNILFHGD